MIKVGDFIYEYLDILYLVIDTGECLDTLSIPRVFIDVVHIKHGKFKQFYKLYHLIYCNNDDNCECFKTKGEYCD